MSKFSSSMSDKREGGDNCESLAANCVRALLSRQGLPKYKQSPWLADVLGISYAQAHRRMTGTSAWTLEDLARVAAVFGETLAQLVDLASPQLSITAAMKWGTGEVPCRVWLGDPIENPDPEEMVAMRLASGWAVLAAGERLHSSNEAGHELYKIERLEARPCVVKRKLIAVLDDDPDLTNSICDFLRAEGYDAKPFYASADLVADSSRRQFEAFVIDWVIGEEMALKLIKGLRERDAAVPIIVLTAHVSTGEVDEADIAQAVKAFGLVFFEKPVRTAILAATIAQAMAMAEQGRA